jgi:hypothetical protein
MFTWLFIEAGGMNPLWHRSQENEYCPALELPPACFRWDPLFEGLPWQLVQAIGLLPHAGAL